MTRPPASTRSPQQPRSLVFRREREAQWTDLELLVDRALARGLSALSPDELRQLPGLYRATLSALMVARETALDRELLRYLNALAGRAYLVVYGNRRPARSVFQRFLFYTFPRTARALWPELGVSSGLFFLAVALSFALVTQEPTWFYAFVDPGLAAGRNPGSSTDQLRAALYDSPEGMLSTFSSFLFTHNTRIGLMSFALGIAAGVPTALLVFGNGLMLGAFLALYAQRGLLVPVLGWLLPHGIPEIGALLLCGAAGLHLGRGILFPGRLDVRDSLRECGRRGALVVAGTVLLFAVAGVIEGVFRQLVVDDGIRYALALFNAVWFSLWLLVAGRGPDREREAARGGARGGAGLAGKGAGLAGGGAGLAGGGAASGGSG